MPATVDAKSALRRQIRHARKSLSVAERRRAEREVSRHARSLLRPGKRIGAYIATGSELDIMPLIERALAHRCEVALPVLPLRGRKMLFSILSDRGSWYLNRYRIPEFAGSHRRARELDILLVPLLGVDVHGYRLGQGGGFYDTTLDYVRLYKKWRRPLLVGVAFDCQRVAEVPREAWDVRLDYLLTESGLHRFGSRQATA